MSARLPLTMARALAPMAPPQSEVHRVISEAELLEADRYLAGPARDPQFFDRKAELAAQHHHERAVYLENKYSRDFS